jgi:OmpA-like transmembrane domain
VSLAAVPRWPINERLSLYGKVGVFHWDADLDVAFNGVQVGGISEEELLAAVGAHYGWPSGFGVLLEYEVVTDLFDSANLGITWHF